MQIVHGSRRRVRDVEHLRSAHDAQTEEAVKAVTRQRLAGAQGELDLGVDTETAAAGDSGPLQIAPSQMTPVWEALGAGHDQLGFDTATEGDEVFRQLVLARIVEPTCKQYSLRMLGEAGVDTVSYPTLKRRLQGYADDAWPRSMRARPAQSPSSTSGVITSIARPRSDMRRPACYPSDRRPEPFGVPG